jgi:hypothetical protein
MSAICYLRRCRSRGVTSPPLQAMFHVARWHISITTGQCFQIAPRCSKGRLAQGPALVVMAQAAWERVNWAWRWSVIAVYNEEDMTAVLDSLLGHWEKQRDNVFALVAPIYDATDRKAAADLVVRLFYRRMRSSS